MVLRTTPKYRYPNSGEPRKFYGCSRFPDCQATHGAHPDGSPLGVPGDHETKLARSQAHAVFDRLWKGPDAQFTQKGAYAWLQRVMRLTPDEAHIGQFNKHQCRQVAEAARAELERS
jgi:ssDNA-binding Zn-finger/Zn-ribbon topoisomerase 1